MVATLTKMITSLSYWCGHRGV